MWFVACVFSDIDADIYVLVDGDCTYEAAAAPRMTRTLIDGNLDLVNGVRRSTVQEAYRPGHRIGNWMPTALVAMVFGRRTSDMLIGYRVFSRRFVKSFPSLRAGFEIETEIIVHVLELCRLMTDVDTQYRGRPAGSASKLGTLRDDTRILRLIGVLIKGERPLSFFVACGVGLFLAAVVLFIPVFIEYLQTGLVRSLVPAPSAFPRAEGMSVFHRFVVKTASRRQWRRLPLLRRSFADALRSVG